MKYSRLAVLWRLGLTGLALWLVGLAAVDGYGQRDQARPADVIVVLGAKVYSGGRPGPALTRRTRHAVALFQRGLAARIICSGGLGENPPTEAAAACGLAEKLGAPAAALHLEERAHSTEENALYTAGMMRERAWRTAIIVSDGFHLYRAALLFRWEGIAAFPSPAQITAGPMNPVERYIRESREIAALLCYWFKTMLGLPITDVQ